MSSLTQIHTNNEEAIDLVYCTNKIEKDLSYTSVSGAKINVPMPEPQIASPGRLSWWFGKHCYEKIFWQKDNEDVALTCDKGPLLVKVLGDAVKPWQIDDAQTKTCRKNSSTFDQKRIKDKKLWDWSVVMTFEIMMTVWYQNHENIKGKQGLTKKSSSGEDEKRNVWGDSTQAEPRCSQYAPWKPFWAFEKYFPLWQAQFCSPITVVILQPNLFVIQLAIGPEIVPVFKRI